MGHYSRAFRILNNITNITVPIELKSDTDSGYSDNYIRVNGRGSVAGAIASQG